jgi:hypothetical protein
MRVSPQRNTPTEAGSARRFSAKRNCRWSCSNVRYAADEIKVNYVVAAVVAFPVIVVAAVCPDVFVPGVVAVSAYPDGVVPCAAVVAAPPDVVGPGAIVRAAILYVADPAAAVVDNNAAPLA